MKSAIVLLPGLNRDRDMIGALTKISGKKPLILHEKDTDLPATDLIVIPGGFSYGDYLRCGAIAARTPVIQAVVEKARRGTPVMGVCNGFQILLETGLLPGTLLRNKSLKFICRMVGIEIANTHTIFTHRYQKDQIIHLPVAHHDGNFFANSTMLERLEGEGQVIFRYTKEENPNGSANNIAGIINRKGNVLGLMPHPENFIEKEHGGTDGRILFESILNL